MIVQQRSTVAIVGGGIAGLAAAAHVARGGTRTVVLERSSTAGGRAATAEHQGFRFNMGPHALYPRAVTLLAELGVRVMGAAPRTASGLAIYRDRRYRLPLGATALAETTFFDAHDRQAFASALRAVRDTESESLADEPLASWLERTLPGERARGTFESVVRLATYTHAPHLISAGAAFAQMRQAGVIYVEGGWARIVDGLAGAAWDAGATIRTGAPVARVEPNGGDWRVRLKSGEAIDAQAVIIAASPRVARQVAGEAAPALARWAEQSIPALSACLDVGLRRVPRPARTFAIGIDQPLYYSEHSAAAPSLAPAGGAAIAVAKYLAPGAARDPSADECELERLLDLVQPGWRAHLVARRFLPAMVATNAIVTAAGGSLAGRPGPAVPGAPGLFVAGDWIGGEGMLADAALASAREAARLAVTAVDARFASARVA